MSSTLYRIILLSLFLSSTPAIAYQEMSLQPVQVRSPQYKPMQLGRTYNYYDGSRVLAAKEANFPILEQFEKLLFPQKDFSKEKPKARLERIEIAVHGNIQKGSVKHRLNSLENEITGWQIANYQTMKILDTKETNSNAFAYPSMQVSQKNTYIQRNYHPQGVYGAPRQNISQKKAVDYDYQNYRLASPVVRDIGRRSIRALFEL